MRPANKLHAQRRFRSDRALAVVAAVLATASTTGSSLPTAAAAQRQATATSSCGTITEQDYYTAADNTYMEKLIQGFEKANPGCTVS